MDVKTLFAAALGSTLLACFVVVAVIFYRGAVRQADRETMREARVILGAATAARTYNSQHVTPLIEEQSDAFHPESVPAFAAQTIMKEFAAAFPEYRYHEKALNPTNVEDFARKWQVDVIENFRADRSLTELSGQIKEDQGQRILYLAQPIRISDPNCLRCHSDPQKAPPAMIAAYHTASGFGWKQDEVIGAKFVMVPTAGRLNVALTNLFWFLIAVGCVLMIGVLASLVVIHHAVTRHALRLAAQADKLSTGDPDGAELAEEGPAEFRTLARAINRLHRSLAAALSDLRERSV